MEPLLLAILAFFPYKSIYEKSSPSRARTYNNSVNSRVLYHWAIEDYSRYLIYAHQIKNIPLYYIYFLPHIYTNASATLKHSLKLPLLLLKVLYLQNRTLNFIFYKHFRFPWITLVSFSNLWLSPRPISKCQLNTLLCLHLIPIYLVVFKGSYSLSWGISHLEGGFTLRCLQRLSLPDLATLPWHWLPTDTPVVRPSRSSRTKDSSSQISFAYAG